MKDPELKYFMKIVCCFIKTGKYETSQLGDLLNSVNNQWKFFNEKYKKTNVSTHLYDDHFVCLKCSQSVVLLNKHLKQCHQITMDQYKKDFDLDNDYPSVPKNYSKTRSAIAKKMKLGTTPKHTY
jgi:predicted transcriptional regulator